MTTQYFSPYEMSTEELYSEIESVDFFGSVSQWSNWCYEVLQERETGETKTVNFDTAKIESEKQYIQDISKIRSTIVREIGKSTFYKISNGLISSMTPSDFKKCTDIADQLNSEHTNFSLTHNISEKFRNNFSSNGYFLRDDIFDIINSVSNLNDSKKVIAGLNRDMADLMAESMEYYEKVLTPEETTSEKKSDLEITAEELGNWFIDQASEKETEEKSLTPEETRATLHNISLFTLHTSLYTQATPKETVPKLKSVSTQTDVSPEPSPATNTTSAAAQNSVTSSDIIAFHIYLLLSNSLTLINTLLLLTSLFTRSILKSVVNFLEKCEVKMSESFVMDDKSAELMKNMMLLAPKQFKVAAQRTLNNFAYDMREEYRGKIAKKMTVRNKSLTRKAIHYTPAVLGPVQAMTSLVGSQNIADRFSGFGEQERQSKPIRKRVITKAGRGSWRSKLAAKKRMDKKFLNISKLQSQKFAKTREKDSDSRKLAYAARLKREGKLGRFGSDNIIVTSKEMFGGNLPKGMYFVYKKNKNVKGKGKMVKGLKTIQYTPLNKTNLMPRRRMMLQNAAKDYFSSERPGKRLRFNMYKQMEIIQKAPFK